MKNKILLYLTMMLTLLTLAACGGGGGGSSNTAGQNPIPAAKTIANFKINLTGTLPAGTTIAGADIILTLPANVAPTMTNGSVATSTVAVSGTFAGSTLSPQVVYKAATASALGTLKVILASSEFTGLSQVGEVATITLQLANGAIPSVDSFPLSAVNVIDTLGNPVAGMTASVAGLTLQ